MIDRVRVAAVARRFGGWLRERPRHREWRIGAALAVAVVIVVGAVLAAGPARGPLAGPEPASFALSPEGDEVHRLSPITLTFAKPPSERTPEELLRVEPAPRGTFAWVSARTLLFQPDFPGLLRGWTYTIQVPARPEAGLAAEVTRRFTVAGQLTVQHVIPGDGDVEVPLNAQVIVQFSRSVAPLTTLAGQRADPVVSFDPPLAGKGEWLNTSIYRFVPSDLRPTTAYRLKVGKGLSSAADGVLKDDFTWTFTTISPAVDAIAPSDNTQFAAPDQKVVVTFNQPMERSASAVNLRHHESGALVPGTIAWSDDGRAATFTPSVRLGADQVYIATAAKGLKGARDGETTAERSSSFRTVGVPRVTDTQPKNGETDAGRFGVNLVFAHPMDPESLEGKLSITGFSKEDLEGKVFAHERGMSASVAFRPRTRYTVTLAAGAKDRYGQVMGAYSWSFTTGAVPSSVSLGLPGGASFGTYSSTREPTIYFQATNTPAASFTLYPLTADEARVLFHDFGRRSFSFTPSQFTPSQPALRTWSETVSGAADEAVLGSTSLSGGGPLAKGFYFLRTGGNLRSEFAFAVVDSVIVTKLSNDELVVWALDHDTGRPIGGVPIAASGPGITSAATTDANGIASFKVPKPVSGSGIDPDLRSYLVTLDAGGRHGLTSTRWQHGVSPYQLGLPSDPYAREWVAHVYTDRPIYRPGETVEFKGVIRADDDASYSIPPPQTSRSPSAEAPLMVVIGNARYQEVRREAIRVNDFGTFAGRFELPADAPLGYNNIRVDFKGSTSAGYNTIATASFRVAEFRKPEFEVDVRRERAHYIDGQTIDARTTAAFFFGGAVAGAPVAWSARSEPSPMRVPGYERYSFSDDDQFRQAVVRDTSRGSGSATTDTAGQASFSVPAALRASEGTQRFTLSATVSDLSAQAVAGSATVTVHPAELYAGIRPKEYLASEGTAARVELVTVDVEGKILPERPVTVKVYERQWITTKAQYGDERFYRSEPRDTLIATHETTTGPGGEGSVLVLPRKPGTLRLVAEVTDARGRISRSATFLWVSGSGIASWRVTNDDTIALVADRDRYEVGDTAEVLVPTPFAGATGLVTVERGKVITRSVQQFPTGSERLRIPITDRSLPNVFVSVVLYRAPTATDPVPRYKVGYVQLPVSTSTRVLNVDVRSDREKARPGDTVHYDIRVTDVRGKGVKAELSLAVVDKAVLALEEERGPNGLRAFWFERGLGVNTGSSMGISMDRWNDVWSGSAKQMKGGATGGGPQQDPGFRQDFRNTAYWSAQVATREDGTAGVDVALPDSLTTWRMQARAISGDTMVGEGTSELVTTRPLLLRPALPRFLRVGDSADLRVLVTNSTGSETDVEVTLEADGVRVDGARSRSAKVGAGRTVALSWPATVDAEGTAKISFSATGTGGLSDAVIQRIPVYLDVTPETTATGGIVTAHPAFETIYLPPFAKLQPGSLSVSVQSALAGSMAEELTHLAPREREGVERVASRLIATLGVRRAERSAGSTSGAHDGAISRDIASIVGRQRPDGAWAWCDDPMCSPDPNVSGWALLALGEARFDGVVIDESVVTRASFYVFHHVNRITDVLAPADPDQKAFLLAALASAGAGVPLPALWTGGVVTASRALFEQYRAGLSSGGRAYLALALAADGTPADDPAVRSLLNDLSAGTIPDANGNHWEVPRERGTFMTSTATTALVTLALARIAPEHALLPQSVRWLVVARGAERWQTSIDRAMSILGLTTYAARTGELAGDFSYKVTLGTSELLAGLVRPGEAPKTATRAVPLTTLTPGVPTTLAFERDTARPGRLYYTLNLRYVTPAQEIEALNRGFAISREYTLLDDPSRPITNAKLGDTVRVKVTIVASADRNYVTVEDLLPAGLEVVDVRARNVDPGLKAKLEADRAAAAQRKAGGYVAPWFRWYYSPWQWTEVRDDRAVLYSERLPKGVYEHVYYARATTPGDFFVAPAHAEQTYFPDVFGRSDSSRFVVGR